MGVLSFPKKFKMLFMDVLPFPFLRIARFDVQLQRMFGVSGDGLQDRLTEFSTPITGSYWFAPSEDDLAAILK